MQQKHAHAQSHGFNCGEAVNFASPDWIPEGKQVHFYTVKQRFTLCYWGVWD